MSVYADDGEPCEIWEEDIRKARKARKCDACHGPIRVGDLYSSTRMFSSGGGGWDVVNRCARCESMYQFLVPVVRQRSGGDEVCALALDCGHSWEEFHKDPPPLVVQALAFLTPDEAQALLTENYARRRSSYAQGYFGPYEQEEARIARLLAPILARRPAEAPEVQAHA